MRLRHTQAKAPSGRLASGETLHSAGEAWGCRPVLAPVSCWVGWSGGAVRRPVSVLPRWGIAGESGMLRHPESIGAGACPQGPYSDASAASGPLNNHLRHRTSTQWASPPRRPSGHMWGAGSWGSVAALSQGEQSCPGGCWGAQGSILEPQDAGWAPGLTGGWQGWCWGRSGLGTAQGVARLST